MRQFFVYAFSALFFFSCNTSSNNKTEENDAYDNPMARQLLEEEKMKDPALGFVPYERLYNAITYTEAAKQSLAPNASLPWEERGPIYDSVGPSNGNRRGGGASPTGAYTSGRMRAFLLDTLNDPTGNTVFTGGVAGGVWKCTNFLSAIPNWQPVNDYFDNLAIASICQDPTNPSVIYFATGEATSNSDAVFGKGVWKSINAGNTFNLLPATANYIRNFKIECDAAGNVYLASRSVTSPVNQPNGLIRSTDGGNTWVNITPNNLTTNTTCTDFEFTASGKLNATFGYLGSIVNHRYTSNPATVTPGGWSSGNGFRVSNAAARRTELAVMGETLYAVTVNTSNNADSCYLSTDGGVNWALQNSTLMPTGLSNGQGWYNLTLAINPTNPSEIMCGGLDAYRSSNAGQTWTRATFWVSTSPYVHADHHYMFYWIKNSETRIIMGTDGGLFYSANNGVSYVDKNRNLGIKQFYSVAIHPTAGSPYLLAGAQDNGTHQLKNPGLSYSIEVTGGDGMYVHINQQNPQIQFGSYVFNQYRRTVNGGLTWSPVNLSSTGLFVNPFTYDDAQNIMYSSNGGNGQIRRWDNANTSSTSVTIPIAAAGGSTALTALHVTPNTANRVYLGTNNGRVLRLDNANTVDATTIDANTTTITGSSFPSGYINCVNTGTDDNNLVAVFTNYCVNNVWVSTNAGASWIAVDGNLPDMPVRWALYDPGRNDRLYIATEAGVYHTDLINGASTIWTPEAGFPTVRTDMLKMRTSDSTIAAGTHGRGVFTAKIPSGCTATTISSQPQNTTVCEGANASFTVSVNGTSPAYQWQVSTDGGTNFTNISGATAATLNLNGVTIAMNNRQYRCVVSGECAGASISTPAVLSISNSLAVTGQPQNNNVCAGANAAFSVTASGASVTYQWEVSVNNGVSYAPVTGATNAALNLTGVTLTMTNNRYRCIVSSACASSVVTNYGLLTVNENAAVSSQPTNQTVCAGASATFSVAATGSPLSYQWQVSTDNGSNFTNIGGQTAATLTLNAVTAGMNNNQYRCVVSSTCPASINSNAALLTVNTAASVASNPSNTVVCEGTSASFNVTASGTINSYQWQISTNGGVNFNDIPGATSSVLNLSAVSAAMNSYQYRCIVNGVCNTVNSNAATLTVNRAPAVSAGPQSVTVCPGSSNIFSVNATGTSITYQWQVSTDGGASFTNINGETAASLTISGITTAQNNYRYRCIVNGVCAPAATTTAATLSVRNPVAISGQPVQATVCIGNNTSFSIAASGNGLTYQWQVSTDGGNSFTAITGATQSVYNLNTVAMALNNNQYRCVLNGDCNTTTSNPALLKVNPLPMVQLSSDPFLSLYPGLTTTLKATVTAPTPVSFVWYRNNNVIPGANANSLTVNIDGLGEYKTMVTDANGCVNTSAMFRIADSISSKMFVYPNPNAGLFQVRYYAAPNNLQAKMITMYDSRGAVVYRKNYTVTGPYDQLTVNMTGYGKGYYLLELADQSGKRIASAKVIVY